MKSFWVDLTIYILLIAVVAVGGVYSVRQHKEARFTKLTVNVDCPDSIVLITAEDVRRELSSVAFAAMFSSYDDIDTDSIEHHLYANSYIDSVVVYKSLDGEVVVDILQKRPMLRVVASNGETLLYDIEGEPLPVNLEHSCRLPILTCGSIETVRYGVVEKNDKKVSENYNFLDNLLNFVKLVDADEFWRSQIVQMNISSGGELELIPRVGGHLVVLCDIEDIDMAWNNLEKLEIFYKKGMTNDMWSGLRKIDLKYRDQVVCER